MNKREFKEKYPLLAEILLWIKGTLNQRRIEKQCIKFHKMSDRELRDYNSEIYYEKIHHRLNWYDLTSYTEKMQWAKLYDDDPRKVAYADKYEVREFVKNTIGEEYLIPLLGVWDDFSQIDFDLLPEQFVMKTNHGTGDAVVIKSKSKIKLAERMRLKRVIKYSLKKDYSTATCEMHYAKIAPKIIAEKFIDSGETDLRDYKFLCFDGVPYFCWVDLGRYTEHIRVVYDINWQRQEWNQYCGDKVFYGELRKPDNFEAMVEIAKKLSAGFSHVRVDLYNSNGTIYFGEMTFTNGAGFDPIIPKSADEMLGKMWNLDM